MGIRSSDSADGDRNGADRKLVLAALGVVFGDIGTSPLYALRECFNPEHGIAVNEANILGLLSLILWSLVLVISIKYVGIVLRADNRGEGGVLALSTLVSTASSNWKLWAPVSAVGLFGAALFFGDGFVTPAISVLSAMEGLTIATPKLERFVLPGAVLILTASVSDAASRHGRDGTNVRPHHADLVPDARGARRESHRAIAQCDLRDQSPVRRALLHQQRRHGTSSPCRRCFWP